MSEPIGMSFSIGGKLPAKYIQELLDIVNDNIREIQGPTTDKELRKEAGNIINWHGTSNYGLCDDLVKFCHNHELSYIHHSEAEYEYDAQINLWTPDMKEVISVTSDSSGNGLVYIEDIRSLTDLLIALVKSGSKALPLFIGDNKVEEFVEKGLKNYNKMLSMLERKINKLLPSFPKLPPFIIKD